MLYCALTFLFLSRSYTFLFPRQETISSSSSFQAIALVIYILSTLFILKSTPIKRFFWESWPLLIFIGLMFASVFWSDIPSKTFSRSIAMFGTLLLAYSLVRTLTMDQLLQVIIVSLGIGAVFSFIFGLFVPSLGIHAGETSIDHIGLWKGVYGFKNHLGRFMLILLLAIFAIYILKGKLNRVQLVLVALSIILLFKSGSSTALMLAVICPISYYLINLLESKKLNHYFKVVFIFILIGLFCFAIQILPWVVTEVFGKDMTGSGRTEIWTAIFSVSQNPLLGHGFGGVFWGEYNSAYYLLDEAWYNLGHAHNGIVDIWIELGYVGLALCLLINFKLLLMLYRQVFIRKNLLLLFPFLMVLFLTLYSLSGGGYVKQNNLMWVLFCCSWFYCMQQKEVAK